MKHLKITLFIICAVLFAAACKKNAPPAQDFVSQSGGFSISTPVELKESTQSIPTPAGNLELHIFSGETPTRGYIVGYADYPEAVMQQSNPQKMLEGARNGAAAQINGKVLKEEQITLDGNPGVEFLMEGKNDTQEALSKARMVLVGRRIYQVLVVGGKNDIQEPEMDGFIRSFKLVKK